MIQITRPKPGFLSIRFEGNYDPKELLAGVDEKFFSEDLGEWVAAEVQIKKILSALKGKPVFINERVKQEALAMAERLAMSRAEAGPAKVVLPDGLALRPFQEAGLRFIEATKGRTLLADEVGLGKGVQTLAWLNSRPRARPVVIVCPNTMKLVWAAEARKWLVGSPKIEILEGVFPRIPRSDIQIINYDVLVDWVEALLPRVVVLDEPQAVKNRDAVRSKAAVALCEKAECVLGLTSTPILNRPAEIWNQLRCIRPELFPRFTAFSQRYCGGGGATNLDELEEFLRSKVMIRRLKRDVLPELPEVTKQTLLLDIPKSGRYLQLMRETEPAIRQYRASREALREAIAARPDARDQKRILSDSAEAASEFRLRGFLIAQIGKLRQEVALMKMEAGLSWIREFMEHGEKLVAFAWHIAIQDRLFTTLIEEFGTTQITGAMTPAQRAVAIKRFQEDPECRIVVCSILAASEGITLTAASDMAAFELPWNPARVDQMVGRVNRIGQSRPCNAYFLVVEDTIEEKMAELIDAKQIVTSSAMGDVSVIQEDQAILESVISAICPD